MTTIAGGIVLGVLALLALPYIIGGIAYVSVAIWAIATSPFRKKRKVTFAR